MECLGNIRARERERENKASFVQNGVVVRARTRHKTRRTIDLCFFLFILEDFLPVLLSKRGKRGKTTERAGFLFFAFTSVGFVYCTALEERKEKVKLKKKHHPQKNDQ